MDTASSGWRGARSAFERVGRLLLMVLATDSLRCTATGESAGDDEAVCETQPTELFEQRILPLLSDDNPKSCNQCHLSGVDYAAFVRDTPCETMACLVEDELVNLDVPAESKILSWISRAEPDSELITEQVIEAERSGFLQWIEASASCPSACRDVACSAKPASSQCAVVPEPEELADENEAREDCGDLALERAFQNDVYAWRGRCFPCHFDNELKENLNAPRFIKTGGNCATAALETLRALAASGYMDVDQPQRSLLLLKPLDMRVDGVGHGGGQKFNDKKDPAYISFLRFLELYSDCQ
jgi:hypothetical protein